MNCVSALRVSEVDLFTTLLVSNDMFKSSFLNISASDMRSNLREREKNVILGVRQIKGICPLPELFCIFVT